MIMLRPISSPNTIPLTIRISRAEGRMHQTQLEHVHRILVRPFIQLLPVHALMGRRVGDWQSACLGPLEGDEADVAVADGGLAEEVETVLWEVGVSCEKIC